MLARDEPAASENQPEPLGDAAHFVPAFLRKLRGQVRLIRPKQMVVNAGGSTMCPPP